MKEKKYIIYKHTSPSGKIYIGQTCKKDIYRFGKNGNGYKHSPHFYSAIQKYGWNNFTHEILYTDLTLQEANYLEKYLIIYYESYCSAKGYNISLGGEEGFKLLPPWNKGKCLSIIHKARLRKSSLNRKDISKEVLCVETGVVYPSAYEAGRVLHTNPSHISACRNGKRKTACGFHWIYVEHPAQEPQENENE